MTTAARTGTRTTLDELATRRRVVRMWKTLGGALSRSCPSERWPCALPSQIGRMPSVGSIFREDAVWDGAPLVNRSWAGCRR